MLVWSIENMASSGISDSMVDGVVWGTKPKTSHWILELPCCGEIKYWEDDEGQETAAQTTRIRSHNKVLHKFQGSPLLGWNQSSQSLTAPPQKSIRFILAVFVM